MRVLTVASEVPPVRSGVAQAAGRVASGLVERGHEVEIRSYADARTLSTDQVRLSTLGVTLRRDDVAAFDLLHLHGPAPTVSDVVLFRHGAHAARTPLVYTHHFTVAGETPWLGWAYAAYGRLALRLAQRATRIVTTTDSYAAMVRTPSGPPTTVIPWGVDAVDARARPDRPAGATLRVLVLGQMRRYKGHQVALDAVGGVDGLELTLAGGGRLEATLRSAAAAHDNVAVRIAPDDAEVEALYRAHDVIALPATNATEAFGIALLEGMARGCVPVGSDLPGVRDVAGPTGRVVPVGDAVALRRTLVAMAADRPGLAAASAASAARAAELTWDRTIDAYDRLFREVVAS